jgi:arginine decarboxylase
MFTLIPKAFFLTRGIGVHKEQLTAFELALRDADIEQQNLVTVSSILPPGCVELEKDAGCRDVASRQDHVRCDGPHRNE